MKRLCAHPLRLLRASAPCPPAPLAVEVEMAEEVVAVHLAPAVVLLLLLVQF